MRCHPLVLVALLLAPLVWLVGTSAAASGAVAVRYDAPVPGAVLRPFVATEHTYGPGHRGVDLVARRGDPAHAAAGGEVTFAGRVAGTRWVTVRHADGVQTSYGALATSRVRTGASVTRGEVIGTATGAHGSDLLRPEPGLHWSARRGEEYVDPLTLLEAPLPRPTLVGAGGWAGTHHVVDPYAAYPGGGRFKILATPSPTATRPGFARPPNHHHLVQLPGYGTEGPTPVLDPDHLGYGPDDSSTFSYRGCTPGPSGCAPRPYGGQDTDLTVDEAAELLDDHLRGLQRAQPNRPVDLLGHSMGGDVATYYLAEHYDPTDPGLPPIGNRVTIATPHGGSGTGTIARAIGGDAILGLAGEALRHGLDALGADGLGRLSFGSQPLSRYSGRVWEPRPHRDEERLAELGVGALEIAGSRDLVVGRIDAGLEGDAFVLPGGHSSVRETEAIRDVVHRFLAGRPLPEIESRVGAGADMGRTLGTIVDLVPLGSVARSIGAGDAAGVLWETGKQLVGGPTRWRDRDDPQEPPMAPAAPQDPLDALS